jgi:hypothetical protein
MFNAMILVLILNTPNYYLIKIYKIELYITAICITIFFFKYSYLHTSFEDTLNIIKKYLQHN